MKKIFVLLTVLFFAVFSVSMVKAATSPKAAAPKNVTKAPAAKVAPTPKKGGELRICNMTEPETLDPTLQQGVPEHRIHMALFENLVAINPKDATPIPGLAKSWNVSKNGKVYTFHLRKTTWSDGVPIIAETVVKSWLRILDPKTAAPYAWFPAMFIAGAADFNAGKNADPNSVKIKAVDALTFQLELVGPLPYVLDAMQHPSFSILPIHVIEKYGKDWTLPEHMVSNGPFILESWKPQEKLTCIPNSKYWDKNNVTLQRVIYIPSDDNNTVHKMFLNGEADFTYEIPLDQVEAALAKEDSYVAPYLGTYYYTIQNKKKPFNDPRVRKALAMSINRKDLTKKVSKAGEIPTTVMVPKMAGYTNIAGNKENLELAKKLLAEAGFPGGKGFPAFEILYNTHEGHKKIAEYIQQQWKENLNIECTLTNQEWKTYLANINAGNFSVARRGWIGDYRDPNTFLDMFVTNGAMNGGKFSNKEYDALIDQASKETNAKKRMEMLAKAENIFITQDQGIIPIYHYVSKGMINRKKFGGFYENVMNYHPPKNIFLK